MLLYNHIIPEKPVSAPYMFWSVWRKKKKRETARENLRAALRKKRENVYIQVIFPSLLIIMLLSFLTIHYSRCGEPVLAFPADSFEREESNLN